MPSDSCLLALLQLLGACLRRLAFVVKNFPAYSVTEALPPLLPGRGHFGGLSRVPGQRGLVSDGLQALSEAPTAAAKPLLCLLRIAACY